MKTKNRIISSLINYRMCRNIEYKRKYVYVTYYNGRICKYLKNKIEAISGNWFLIKN